VFGLFPEFSTPVEKAVENRGFWVFVLIQALFYAVSQRRNRETPQESGLREARIVENRIK